MGMIVVIFSIGAGPARAAITISNGATRNLSCVAAQCVPTASDAVLNVHDLEALLATGDLSISTTGNGIEAGDVLVTANVKWPGGATLAFVAHNSVSVRAAITVRSGGGLSIATNNVGTGDLSFGAKGTINLNNVSSKFTLNGQAYALAGDIGALASLTAAKPDGHFALANDFSLTTAYSAAPLSTDFKGTLEGLGHVIDNLEITSTDSYMGLFAVISHRAVVRDLKLSGVNIYSSNPDNSYAGALAGMSQGTIEHVQAEGMIGSNFWVRGGGIVGLSYGSIRQSFTNMYVWAGVNSELGGIAGNAHGPVTDCYALGKVNGGDNAFIGGLIGYSLANVRTSYATGLVEGGHDAVVGGFEGAQPAKRVSRSYWDITTSGTQKSGGEGDIPGVTGLTTEQLRSGLPKGLDPAIWAEDQEVNGGLPYLIANPPEE
jgi:hypothetical protein